MSYIGNSPYQVAFLTDTFSGNNSTTAFTMSVAPANTSSVLVAVSGVLQDPSTYSVSGTTLTFSAAPPTGTGNISARYLGIPASGVTTTAYRTVTEFTATAGQKTFTPPSYTVGFINVYRNGVLLGSADYAATNGTTVVLTGSAAAGDLVTVESFLVSSVLNAVPNTGGTITGNLIVTGTETVPTITSPSATALTLQSAGTTAVTIDTSQNVGIGTTSPTSKLNIGSGGVFRLNRSDNATYNEIKYNTGDQFYFNQANGGVYTFNNNGAEQMRIDSSGNLLVGTTNAGGRTATIVNTSWYTTTTAAGANMVVATDGTVYRSTSALKYKQDVRDLESIDINKFRPVRYKSNAEFDDQTKDYFGVIADEVDEAGIKELVNYGAEGEVEGFQYERLTVVLLKAIQELKAENDALKERLDKAGL